VVQLDGTTWKVACQASAEPNDISGYRHIERFKLKSIQAKQVGGEAPGKDAVTSGSAAPAAVSQPTEEAVSPGTVPVNMIVSVEAKHGKRIPTIYRDDVRVLLGRDRFRVTNWVPLEGAQAGLELFVLVDDGADSRIGSQFDDLRQEHTGTLYPPLASIVG